MKSGKSIVPCPAAVTKLPSGAAILGMRHDDAVGKQIDRLGDDAAAARRRSPARPGWRGRARSSAAGSSLSSIRRRAFAAESTTLARSGSMPRSTSCRSAMAIAASMLPRRSRQASGVALSGWRRHWSSAIARAGAEREQPRSHRLARLPRAPRARRGRGAAPPGRDGSCCRWRRRPRARRRSPRPRPATASVTPAGTASGIDGRPEQAML